MSSASSWGRWIGLAAIVLLGVPVCQADETDQPYKTTITIQGIGTGSGQGPEIGVGEAKLYGTAEVAKASKPCDKCKGACSCTPEKNCGKCEGECKCAAEDTETEADVSVATHKQVGLIPVNFESVSQAKVTCFCLALDGRVLAGCNSGDSGEVRVFEADGSYIESWSVPVAVEAINVRKSDGVVFIAGEGKLVKLSSDGNLIEVADSPHVSQLDTTKLREQAIAQQKRMYQTYKSQVEIFDQRSEQMAKQLEELNSQLAGLEEADREAKAPAIEQQIAMLERQSTTMARMSESWKKRVADMSEEPSEEAIQAQVNAAIQRKRAVASVSAVGDTVYVGCSSAVGYGYSIWKCTADFKTGEEIVSGLRGCCGQMDVQASENGVYVAENARHRVARFDDAGELTKEWGGRVRDNSSIDGFGSCCNPMNLAFGPDGNVYTAEDSTGRIKCYTPEGQLVSHVGHADLVPGCKKVSIGVSSTGEHVYMLDITRNHIVHMQQLSDEEFAARAAEHATEAEEQQQKEAAAATSATATGLKADATESTLSSGTTTIRLSRILLGQPAESAESTPQE